MKQSEHHHSRTEYLNSFQANAPFQYLLKISKNRNIIIVKIDVNAILITLASKEVEFHLG